VRIRRLRRVDLVREPRANSGVHSCISGRCPGPVVASLAEETFAFALRADRTLRFCWLGGELSCPSAVTQGLLTRLDSPSKVATKGLVCACRDSRRALESLARSRLTRPRWRRGRIGRGWQRGVVRVAAQALFEIGDAVLKPPVRLDQPGDLHQQGERRLAVALEDRLRLGAFPSARVRRTQEGPCLPAGRGDLNAYQNLGLCSTFAHVRPSPVMPAASFLDLVSLVRFQPGAPLLACAGRFLNWAFGPVPSETARSPTECRDT
jgi:hypothetical protein